MKKGIQFSILLSFFFTLGTAWAQQATGTGSKYTLRFNSQAYEPQANAATFISKKTSKNVLLKSRSASGMDYMVLQFSELPSNEEISSYKAQGITLGLYIANNAYFATVDPSKSGKKYRNMEKLYSAFATTDLSKIDARIRENRVPDYAKTPRGALKLTVSVYKNISKQEVLNALHGLPYERLFVSEALSFFDVQMNASDLERVSSIPWVISINLTDPAPVHFDKRNRGVSGENFYIQRNPSKNLTGKGVTVGIWDTNLEEHPDITGRLTINQKLHPSTVEDHGMHVVGIMTGSGAKDNRAIGIAPELKVEAYNYAWDETHYDLPPIADQMYTAYTEKGIRVSQNSYGPGINTSIVPKFEYSARSVNFDALSNRAKDLLNVFACGNYGSAVNQWSTVPYSAKNILLVANIDERSQLSTSSSRGPTMSGAIIPQVAVVGENVYSLGFYEGYNYKSGTSMACPFVSGVAGLVYQRYKELYGGVNPISSLAKALICNGATDIYLPGPDYGTGFGEVNILSTMKMLENKQFLVDSVVTNGQVREYVIEVPKGTEEVKAMLAWNDPYATPETVESTLINNLDLEVVYDRTYYPLVPDPLHPEKPAVEKVDNLSNILQVTLKAPAGGKIKIRVIATHLPKPTQEFALVYSFAPKGITLLTPVDGEPIATGEDLLLKWHSVGLSGPVTVELSKDGGATYPDKLSVSDVNYVKLAVSDQVNTARFRLSQNGYFFESGTMPIVGRVKNLKLTSNPNDYRLSWDGVNGVFQYEILRLKEDKQTYEVIDSTYALNYTVNSAQIPYNTYFSVRAKVDKARGERAVGVAVNKLQSQTEFPLHIDFNNGLPDNIRLSQALYSGVVRRYIPDHGRSVLMFRGKLNYLADLELYGTAWLGGIGSGSGVKGDDATLNGFFTSRANFLSAAKMSVALPAGKKIIMKVRVRMRSSNPEQTNGGMVNPSNQEHNSLFRIKANGTPISTAAGKIVQVRSYKDISLPTGYDYRPLNIRTSPDLFKNIFEDKYYDLSAYAGQTVNLDFEALCATAPYLVNSDPEGSQVYIASIDIEEQQPYQLVVTSVDSTGGGFSYMVNANDLLGKKVRKPVYAQVANIGSNASAGNVKMLIARSRNNDTLEVNASVPSIAPFKYRWVNMDSVDFDNPESHKLMFQAQATSSAAAPVVSFTEYNLDSYENADSLIRMFAGGQSAGIVVYGDKETRFTDFGATIFPYVRYAGYAYPYKFVPADVSKRVKMEFSAVDLMAGDTIYILSNNRLLGKAYGKTVEGGPFISIAPDGSIDFTISTDPTNGLVIATAKGWEGSCSLVSKVVNRDIALVRPFFTRPKNFADGTKIAIVIENQGATTMPLNFKPTFQFANMPKVEEANPFFALYSSTLGVSNNQIFTLDPGTQAYMEFTTPMKGNDSTKVNQTYPLVLNLGNLVDDIPANNTISNRILYGDGPVADDFGPNAFVTHFEMAGVSRTETNYGYRDFTNQIIKVEMGKGYPFQVIIDGRQSKLLEAVLIADYNHNKVFEESEVIDLDGDGTENHNVYNGEFWPHMYFKQAGDYGFRVAAFQNGNMSAWEFTLRVVGTPIAQDAQLKNLSIANTQLIASSIAELTLDIVGNGYSSPVPASISYSYTNANNVEVASGNMAMANISNGRQSSVITIPVPAGVPAGNYKLTVALNTGGAITDNNKKTLDVTINTELLLYTTTSKGRIAYASPASQPANASRMKTDLTPFKVSNTNAGAWVTDQSQGIDNWYVLSEQYTRSFDNKTFYENRLVKFNFNNSTQHGHYDTLAVHFNGTRIHSIAFDPAGKTLFGLGSDGSRVATIYTINYQTGAATPLKTISGVRDTTLTGLAVDLGGNLYSVHNRSNVVLIDTATATMAHFAAISTVIPATARVNMVYDFKEQCVLFAYQNAAGVGSLHKVIPTENRTSQTASFGTTNQSYSLAIPSVSNPVVDTVMFLDRFDITGQLYSMVDNETKSVTIVLTPGANKAGRILELYNFANGNAVLKQGGTTLPKSGATLNLSTPITLSAVSKYGKTVDWTINAQDASSGVEITKLQFLQAYNPVLTADITATISGSKISATVPSSANIAALVPTIITNVPLEDERVTIGNQRIKSNSSVVDFSASVLLNVQAIQLNLSAAYEVTVTREPSTGKDLIDFAFLKANNPILDQNIYMQNENGSRYMVFPHGVDRSGLKPTFTISPQATLAIGGKVVVSGNFDKVDASSNLLNINVLAENKDSALYAIAIREESSEAKLLSFDVLAASNPGLTQSIIGAIDEQNSEVGMAIPAQVDRHSLSIDFSAATGGKLVMAATNAELKAGDALDFSAPFEVYVLAENGMARKSYTVKPYVKGSSDTFVPSLAVNPAKEYTTIVGAAGSKGYLFDSKGRLVKTITVTGDAMRLEVSDLEAGVYYLRLDNGGAQKNITLIKK